ncbi:haloacid dehalogenase-like hydrolase [Roseateles saccharophilus]|uniref:haloacid dehalogenase-like hydrolase n=1 Tax=Roseateles saccharophilus TaxID=304 RepID=UPI0010502E9C|nr:haloacid dehalogenase-like hydrolase [Roseateles saccharophilus]MDG0835889.1 hypothetical protein [Roseateles saccharophilus]
MNKNAVVFDVDKTLVFGDLHSIIIKLWLKKNRRYAALHEFTQLLHAAASLPFLKRKIEYLFTALIPAADIHPIIKDVLTDDSIANKKLLRRIVKYKKAGAQVFLVSAAPERIINILAKFLQVEAIASKTITGVLIRDYLAKKSKAYNLLLSKGLVIRTIYSDSELDFSQKSKNFLIDHHSMVLKT